MIVCGRPMPVIPGIVRMPMVSTHDGAGPAAPAGRCTNIQRIHGLRAGPLAAERLGFRARTGANAMDQVTLASERVVLDSPMPDDVDDITRHCQDPLFERYLTVPWPYRRADADYFVNEHVPAGWATGRELTWAIRTERGGPLLGVIGLRVETSDIGFWMGAEHRGLGHMSEALRLVADWTFDTGCAGIREIGWECLVGNTASASVARRCGFRFTGERPSRVAYRDGSHPPSWTGALRDTDDRSPTSEWPA